MNTSGQPDRPARIGVLMGGASSERDISVKSGTAVAGALREHGYDVVEVDVPGDDPTQVGALLKNAFIDAAFIALHGVFGEDGVVQSLLEQMGIPYTGSDAKASAVAINKPLTQEALRESGILVPDFVVLHRDAPADVQGAVRSLNGWPLVVKPACEGSSIGVTIVRSAEELAPALARAFDFGQEVLVDRYVKGRELTVGILDGKALSVVEIRPHGGAFFDFNAKYQKGATDYLVPAPLPDALAAQIRQTAVDAFRALGCRDFARADFMLDEHQRAYVLEVNTIPGFTATSLLPMAAREAGMDFGRLCSRIVEMAQARRRREVPEEEVKHAHPQQDRP